MVAFLFEQRRCRHYHYNLGFYSLLAESRHLRHFSMITATLIKSFITFGLDWWGAPGPCNSATHGRPLRAPVASYFGGLFPSRNKFNIVWTNGPHIRY